VQKGPLFSLLTTVGVMLERSEASQGGADPDNFTFLHFGQYLHLKFNKWSYILLINE
jgi:hypothetical protein